MNTSFFTNLMLVVIAALLLILVIQNGMSSSKPSYSMKTQSSDSYQGRNPHQSPPPGATMGSSMFFSALRGFPEGCDSSKLLAECDSPQAQAVKEQIAAFAKGKGPRQVFDFIIETWGEEALSEQALRIRKQVRGQ